MSNPFRHDPAMDAPQDNGREFRRRRVGGTDAPTTPFPAREPINFPIRDPLDRTTIRFGFTRGTLFDRARIYTLPRELALEIFPRIDAHGERELYMRDGGFMINRFLATTVEDHSPPEQLVDPYHTIFDHISMSPRSCLYQKAQFKDNRDRRSLDEVATVMMGMAMLLSSPRGLGADGWLLNDFATTCGRIWQDGLDHWGVNKKKWCFIFILEAFVDALRGETSAPEAVDSIMAIWGGMGRDTQRAVENKINQEAMNEQILGRRLRVALDDLFDRMDRVRVWRR